MDIQILREFADLAYTLNFKKTADRMFIGKSTLSKHILVLEQELGIQLFVRTKHGVSLTRTGEELLPRVRRILQEYNEVLSIVQKGKDNISGQLRIGFLDSAVRDLLSESIRIYQTKYPNMKIVLNSLQVGELSSAFKNNAVDIALTINFPNSFIPPGTVFKPLYDDSVSAVLPQGHPLAAKEHLFLEDLLLCPISLPSPHQYPSYAQLLKTRIDSSPITENVVSDYSHIETALIMVEADMCVSILPSNINSHTSSCVFRTIEDFQPVLQVGAMWRQENHATGMPEYIDVLFHKLNGRTTYNMPDQTRV